MPQWRLSDRFSTLFVRRLLVLLAPHRKTELPSSLCSPLVSRIPPPKSSPSYPLNVVEHPKIGPYRFELRAGPRLGRNTHSYETTSHKKDDASCSRSSYTATQVSCGALRPAPSTQCRCHASVTRNSMRLSFEELFFLSFSCALIPKTGLRRFPHSRSLSRPLVCSPGRHPSSILAPFPALPHPSSSSSSPCRHCVIADGRSRAVERTCCRKDRHVVYSRRCSFLLCA